MNICSTFVHTVNQRIESYGDTFAILRVICPEIGNVQWEKRTPAIHPPGTYQTIRKKHIGISGSTPYWYLHDWFSRRCPSPVKFVCLIPRCRTRGFGGSPWTFLLTVSCWSPRLFCPESGGIPHGIHLWELGIILDPWVLLGMGLYWHTRHIDFWWPNWTFIVTIDTAMNTGMDILGDCLWYLVIICDYMILYPWILATQNECMLLIRPFFLDATHWYSSSSSRNETSEETWALSKIFRLKSGSSNYQFWARGVKSENCSTHLSFYRPLRNSQQNLWTNPHHPILVSWQSIQNLIWASWQFLLF